MIPRVINYIWVGGKPLSSSTKMVINTWRRNLPGYKIVRWDESNLPINEFLSHNKFFRMCRKYKLYAFMSDYIRLWVLYNYGGIYLDTDVEVVKSFDDLLDGDGFIGFETGTEELGEYIGTGVIGAVPHNETIKRLLKFYEDDIWHEKEYVNTIIFKKIYLQDKTVFKDLKIYPSDYFAPFSPYIERSTDTIVETKNTYAIHWYNSSWNLTKSGYAFISTKYISNPIVREITKLRRLIGYYKNA